MHFLSPPEHGTDNRMFRGLEPAFCGFAHSRGQKGTSGGHRATSFEQTLGEDPLLAFTSIWSRPPWPVVVPPSARPGGQICVLFPFSANSPSASLGGLVVTLGQISPAQRPESHLQSPLGCRRGHLQASGLGSGYLRRPLFSQPQPENPPADCHVLGSPKGHLACQARRQMLVSGAQRRQELHGSQSLEARLRAGDAPLETDSESSQHVVAKAAEARRGCCHRSSKPRILGLRDSREL